MVVKMKLNLQANTLERTDKAVFLKDEAVIEVCEYSPDNLIISALYTQNLIKCEGLEKFTDIQAPKTVNDQKLSIQLMPGFNVETYPMFVVTGKSEIWLGNINNCKMESLVLGSSQPFFSQDGVVFLPKRKDQRDPDSTRFVFDSDFINKSNKTQYQIHEMTLYSDFKETIMKIGHLPEVTVDNVVKQELKIRDLEARIAELEAKQK